MKYTCIHCIVADVLKVNFLYRRLVIFANCNLFPLKRSYCHFLYHSCTLITFVLYYFGTMCKIYCVVREMDLLCICEWRWFALASVPISINLMSSCKLSEGMCYLKSEGPCFFEYSYELILIYFIQYNFMAQKYTLKLEYFHIMVE